MIIQLSDLSLTTSISNSFQPTTDSSTNISLLGELFIPSSAMELNSSKLLAIPPPVPPRVNEGLIITGRPISLSFSFASSKLCAIKDFGVSSPMEFIASLNSSRFSAFDIASSLAPINSTLYSFKKPEFDISRETLRAVCPPIVGSNASGFSFSIIFFITSSVIGSI